MGKNCIWKTVRIGLLSVLLVLCIGPLLIGNSWGRYQKEKKEEVTFVAKSAGIFQFAGLEDRLFEEEQWTVNEEDGSMELAFRVINEDQDEINGSDASFQIHIASTLGTILDEAKVSLIVEGTNGALRTYEGVAEAFEEESELYEQMGPGCEYRFYDDYKEELIFTLPGGQLTEQKFIVRVENSKTPTLLEFILTEVPLKS